MGSICWRWYAECPQREQRTGLWMSYFHGLRISAIGEGESQPSFRVGIELPSQVPVVSAIESAVGDMGIDFVNFYVSNTPEHDVRETETLEATIALCERLGLDFALACHHRDPARSLCQEGFGRSRKL